MQPIAERAFDDTQFRMGLEATTVDICNLDTCYRLHRAPGSLNRAPYQLPSVNLGLGYQLA